MTTDVLFIIRKEDTDNKYKIVDERDDYGCAVYYKKRRYG